MLLARRLSVTRIVTSQKPEGSHPIAEGMTDIYRDGQWPPGKSEGHVLSLLFIPTELSGCSFWRGTTETRRRYRLCTGCFHSSSIASPPCSFLQFVVRLHLLVGKRSLPVQPLPPATMGQGRAQPAGQSGNCQSPHRWEQRPRRTRVYPSLSRTDAAAVAPSKTMNVLR